MSANNHASRVYIGGISGGIGSAIAKRLSSANWTVGGFGRDKSALNALQDAHGDWTLAEVEATDAASMQAAFEQFIEQHGGMDAYIHAVGNVFLKPLHLTSPEEWDGVIATNLSSAFTACRLALGPMRKQKSGSIVLFSSVAAVSGLANHEAIAAAKGGIDGLVKSLAATYANVGIRSNAIAPGLVRTKATAALTASEQAVRISEKLHPLGRLGEADEVASLAAWLVSDDASWMTGQTLSLDGGMSAIVPKPRA
jgi:NAD(P)-dependent dehydrogenase (short-subunit alcohol dehydrogenase family)